MTATCALDHHRLIANSRAETNKLMQWYTSQSKTIGHECDPIVRRSRLEKLDQQMADYRRLEECFHRTASQGAAHLMRATAARLSPMPPRPPGAFLVPIASTMCEPTKHCTILCALGRMNCVPWDGNQSAAIDLAATILAAQIQPHLRTNARQHIGHVVLALPHQSGAFPFVWDGPSAMLASRHAMHSLGANPNRHDAMVIHHRQRVALGADHNEEALHLVYSRVRDDGWFLKNPHASVSLHLGLARFDHAAGLGARLGIARPSSMPVYWGYRHVEEGTLTASLASPRNGESDENISLLSQDFLDQLAQEGVPTRGSCGGIWLQKQTLRDHEEIHSLLTYLMGRQ